MYTVTQTNTYTVTDVRRVVASFGADFSMISQVTGLWDSEDVRETVSDLNGFAEAGYLEGIHLILWDAHGTKLRAAKYTVSTSAASWSNDRPGGNLWPRTPGGRLQVIGTLSSDWWAMDEAAKDDVRKRYGIAGAWCFTNTDTSHASMSPNNDRRYASNAYGMERTIYT
jgi:hypothetical protein